MYRFIELFFGYDSLPYLLCFLVGITFPLVALDKIVKQER